MPRIVCDLATNRHKPATRYNNTPTDNGTNEIDAALVKAKHHDDNEVGCENHNNETQPKNTHM